MKPVYATSLILALLGVGCVADEPATATDEPDLEGLQPAFARITAESMLAHIRVLADDSMEGRAPATPGEERTVRYLTEQFQAMGLEPGNPDGTYVQNVPMVGITSDVAGSLRIAGSAMPLNGPTDYIASTLRAEPEVRVADSELVFVGYGVVAPEYGWDDFKGVDVRGKTIVMLVNDPPVPSAADSAVLDTAIFRGRAMTLYGRWTYKYQIAAEKGAAAALIVHETGPAGYPFEVLSAGWGRETFDVRAPLGSAPPVPVQGWLTEPAARRVLAAAGQDFDQLKAAARRQDFRPVPLNGTASFTIRNQLREVQSRNVIAKLTGTERPDEYIIYTAHWDHLGRDTTRSGDQIFNGALDNASGTAAMLEIAKAFAQNQPRPKRSILFLAVTAEEKGLLGAKYYAENPLYPLTQTLANINMDGVNQWGRTSDLGVIGLGNSTLDDVLALAVAPRGRTLAPDAEPEKGFYYRSDHFEFAKQGVPALYIRGGTQYIGKPTDFSQRKREEYTANDYHKPSDEIKPDWDLSGAVEDAQILLEVGYRVAQAETWPEWSPGTEFRARREQMLGGSR
ncbi:MAG TPA: M20/M25/M40 family metallo-hydrolase [Longimicrobiales bacterium]|nr:M20/M25/M40 family metallo-hydrolase [Longimicrobiales bacterium]